MKQFFKTLGICMAGAFISAAFASQGCDMVSMVLDVATVMVATYTLLK